MGELDEINYLIGNSLERYSYLVERNITIPNVQYLSYVRNPQILRARNLFAILEVPGNVLENATAKHFFSFVRKSLLDKYGDAFLWKELELIFVVFCGNQLYEVIKNDEGRSVDVASFSLNAMVGSCFINKVTFDYFAHSTWGLYFSGDHFNVVREIVEQWCEEKKKTL